MRKLFAFSIWVPWLIALAQPLPKPIGAINDYGQTLERIHRQELSDLVQELSTLGISFVYLASWHDPFGNLDVYTYEIFRAWGLGQDAALVIFLRDETGTWQVGGKLGITARTKISEADWATLLSQAEQEARARPAVAVLNLARALIDLVTGNARQNERSIWPYFVFGVLGSGVAVLIWRHICPRCFRPLYRGRWFSGIIWVCPRCRYTRGPWRGEG